MEIWKDVVGYENHYSVSNTGIVKSKLRMVEKENRERQFVNTSEKILKQAIKQGYSRVSLSKKGKVKEFRVHRLVAIAFIPNPENKKEVNHINGIKNDNRVENLSWCTPAENIKHAWDKGLTKRRFNSSDSKKVMKMSIDGEDLEEYPSVAEAMRLNGIKSTGIYKCCSGKGKLCGGYGWRFVDENKHIYKKDKRKHILKINFINNEKKFLKSNEGVFSLTEKNNATVFSENEIRELKQKITFSLASFEIETLTREELEE